MELLQSRSERFASRGEFVQAARCRLPFCPPVRQGSACPHAAQAAPAAGSAATRRQPAAQRRQRSRPAPHSEFSQAAMNARTALASEGFCSAHPPSSQRASGKPVLMLCRCRQPSPVSPPFSAGAGCTWGRSKQRGTREGADAHRRTEKRQQAGTKEPRSYQFQETGSKNTACLEMSHAQHRRYEIDIEPHQQPPFPPPPSSPPSPLNAARTPAPGR